MVSDMLIRKHVNWDTLNYILSKTRYCILESDKNIKGLWITDLGSQSRK